MNDKVCFRLLTFKPAAYSNRLFNFVCDRSVSPLALFILHLQLECSNIILLLYNHLKKDESRLGHKLFTNGTTTYDFIEARILEAVTYSTNHSPSSYGTTL